MKVLTLLSVFLLVGVATSQDGARLLAAKNILNEYIVEGKDLTVLYSIYNVGSSAAINVALSDETFPDTDFELIQGQLSVQWERISPGSNVSHSVILQPLKSQFFNFTSAIVTYLPTEDGTEKSTFTSSPGEKGIVSLKEFDKRFSPHYVWRVFGHYQKVIKKIYVKKPKTIVKDTATMNLTCCDGLGVFAVMTIPPICIPFLLWSMSKIKYESSVAAGKSKKN